MNIFAIYMNHVKLQNFFKNLIIDVKDLLFSEIHYRGFLNIFLLEILILQSLLINLERV